MSDIALSLPDQAGTHHGARPSEMMMTMRRLAYVVMLLFAASCGRSEPLMPGGGGSSDLVLRVSSAGGFLPTDAAIAIVPELSLFGDGSVITTGPQIEIYPGSALPNLQRRVITSRGIETILQAAKEAGLIGPDRTLRNPGVADAPTTTFTVVADGKRHVVAVEAMGIEPTPGTVSDDEMKQREAIEKFNTKLGDLKAFLGEDAGPDEAPFRFDELRIFVRPPSAPSDPSIKPQVKDWPLAARPLATFGAEGSADQRCGTVSGNDLETLRSHVESANQLTQWRSAQAVYHLVFRPLLPDESGC